MGPICVTVVENRTVYMQMEPMFAITAIMKDVAHVKSLQYVDKESMT